MLIEVHALSVPYLYLTLPYLAYLSIYIEIYKTLDFDFVFAFRFIYLKQVPVIIPNPFPRERACSSIS